MNNSKIKNTVSNKFMVIVASRPNFVVQVREIKDYDWENHNQMEKIFEGTEKECLQFAMKEYPDDFAIGVSMYHGKLVKNKQLIMDKINSLT